MSKQKIIDSLTPEQEAQIPVYADKFRAIGMSTGPTDRAAAENAIRRSYKYLAASQSLSTDPEFVWADSPMAGAVLAAQHAKGSLDVTQEEVRAQAEQASYGSFEAYWVSVYAFIGEQLPVEKDELLDIVINIVKNCGVYWTFTDLVVLTPKPTEIHMENEKLHNVNGPAMSYPDGSAIYALNGERKESLVEVIMAYKASK